MLNQSYKRDYTYLYPKLHNKYVLFLLETILFSTQLGTVYCGGTKSTVIPWLASATLAFGYTSQFTYSFKDINSRSRLQTFRVYSSLFQCLTFPFR